MRRPLRLDIDLAARPERPDTRVLGPELVAGAQVGFLDELDRAENTIVSFTDQAQHLGSPYRTWLWVTPVLGAQMYGVTFRIDLR